MTEALTFAERAVRARPGFSSHSFLVDGETTKSAFAVALDQLHYGQRPAYLSPDAIQVIESWRLGFFREVVERQWSWARMSDLELLRRVRALAQNVSLVLARRARRRVPAPAVDVDTATAPASVRVLTLVDAACAPPAAAFSRRTEGLAAA